MSVRVRWPRTSRQRSVVAGPPAGHEARILFLDGLLCGPLDASPSPATVAFMCGRSRRRSPTGRLPAFRPQPFLPADRLRRQRRHLPGAGMDGRRPREPGGGMSPSRRGAPCRSGCGSRHCGRNGTRCRRRRPADGRRTPSRCHERRRRLPSPVIRCKGMTVWQHVVAGGPPDGNPLPIERREG